ncbi:DinB family protein [Stieleria sp. JC731]|uniref:DinB family protein n=1 Tax=Pirellulaceae TaxID=2691357 RepID=UPI001E4ED8D0|nr:DinB family protein [Stieleria sp. JC731]MCC9599027.1 DinB family protein [Stieleria sp. JC731]
MATLSEIMLPEFDREMPRTRDVLAAIPADKMDWQADEKLHTIGWNANHIADCVGWTKHVTDYPEFDIQPEGCQSPTFPALSSPGEVLALFDKNVAEAREAIANVSDEELAKPWSLLMSGQTLFTISKEECLRNWVFNHIVHHRGILSVYLRMAGIEMRSVFGA